MPGFISSGNAVSDSLEQVLGRRKAEARQAMLDEIMQAREKQNLEQGQVSMDATRENTAANKLWRQAQADQLSSATQLKNAQQLMMGQTLDASNPPNIDPSLITRSPQHPDPITTGPDIAYGPLAGDQYGQMGTAPSIPGALQPNTDADQARFAGLPDDRRLAAKQQQLHLVKASPEFKSADPLHQIMMLNEIANPNDTINPGTYLNPPADKHSPAWTEYQDYAASLAPGVKKLDFDAYQQRDANRRQSLAGGGGYNSQFIADVNPGTGVQTGKFFWADPRKQTVTEAQMPAPQVGPQQPSALGGTKPPPAVANALAPKKPLVDTRAAAALANAISKAKTGTSINPFSKPARTPESEAQIGVLVGQIIGAADTTDDVKQNAQQVVSDRALDKHSNQEVVAHAFRSDNVTPLSQEEKSDLLQILSTIRPGK